MTTLIRAEPRKLQAALSKFEGFDVIRVILGLILLLAAALKVHQLATEPMVRKGLLSSWWFFAAEIECETFLGVFLIYGIYKRQLWRLSLICFGAFACITFHKGMSGDSSCGCFGSIEVSPWYTFAFDLCAFTSLLICPSTSIPHRRPTKWFLVNSVACMTVLAFLGVIIMSRLAPSVSDYGEGVIEYENHVVLEPEAWIGKPIPVMKDIDIAHQVIQGRWALVFIRSSCADCQGFIRTLNTGQLKSANQFMTTRLAFIEVPPASMDASRFESSYKDVTFGTLTSGKQWFLTTPTMLILENGIVREIYEGLDKIEESHQFPI